MIVVIDRDIGQTMRRMMVKWPVPSIFDASINSSGMLRKKFVYIKMAHKLTAFSKIIAQYMLYQPKYRTIRNSGISKMIDG